MMLYNVRSYHKVASFCVMPIYPPIMKCPTVLLIWSNYLNEVSDVTTKYNNKIVRIYMKNEDIQIYKREFPAFKNKLFIKTKIYLWHV